MDAVHILPVSHVRLKYIKYNYVNLKIILIGLLYLYCHNALICINMTLCVCAYEYISGFNTRQLIINQLCKIPHKHQYVNSAQEAGKWNWEIAFLVMLYKPRVVPVPELPRFHQCNLGRWYFMWSKTRLIIPLRA